MCSVNFNEVEAGLLASLGSEFVLAKQVGEIWLVGFDRIALCLGEGDGRGPVDIIGPSTGVLVGNLALGTAGLTADPRCDGRGLAAGVGELDPDFGALAMDEGGDPLEGRNLAIGPETGILWGDSAFGDNGGGLNADGPDTTSGERTEMLAKSRRVISARTHLDPEEARFHVQQGASPWRDHHQSCTCTWGKPRSGSFQGAIRQSASERERGGT